MSQKRNCRKSPPGIRAVAAPVNEVVDVAGFALRNGRRCTRIWPPPSGKAPGVAPPLPSDVPPRERERPA
jgi:hypothetical protein